jgi:hypothetical protein
MTYSYVGFDRSSENFCLTLLTVSITMTCKRVNLSFTLFMTFKDNVHGWEDGSAEVKCATYFSSWYLWYNLLSFYTKLPAPNFSQPSGFPIAIVVHGPAQNTAGWEIHTCLKDTK